ncbi:unnamed protein product [Fusarium langsethiae]|nr:unnamed protein product [Fusarium langsethiae]
MAYGYGAFDLFLRRNLLWMRIDLDKKKIKYEDNREVPSWSWMAYEGGIRFISFTEIPYGELEEFKDMEFGQERRGSEEKRSLRTKVWKFQGCDLSPEAPKEGKHRLLSPSEEIGWIIPDEENFEIAMKRAVVVGLVGKNYYILVVKERENKNKKYERVGIGMIQQGYLSKQDGDVDLV